MTLEIPKIGLGTWLIGGGRDKDPNYDVKMGIEAIQNAIRNGLYHIDTASLYGDGAAEEIIGKAIKEFDRNKLIIASKVKRSDMDYDGIINSCKESLKRLQLDYLDIFYIHFPNPDFPVSETARAFNDLMEEGLIKHIGICNACIETIEKYAEAFNYPISIIQEHYNLVFREPSKRGVIEYCKEKNIPFVAWRPLQKEIPDINIKDITKTGNYPILDGIAKKNGKTNAQIAIKWLISQDNVYTIFKTTNAKHLQEAIDCNNFELSKEDIQELTDNFPNQQEVGRDSRGPLPLG